MTRARSAVRAVLTLVLVAALPGGGACAHKKIEIQKLDDGTVRVRCRAPLTECLKEGVEPLCEHRPYLVVRAVDEHNLRGDTLYPTDERTSQALVRCAQTNTVGALGPKPMESGVSEFGPPAPATSPSAPAPSPTGPRPRVCAPGLSQACIGKGGCSGGQACLADASGFEPCDCGGTAVVPATPYP